MEFVTKKVTYNLFKPTGQGDYFFIRVVALRSEPHWGMGYKNKFGEVHLIGGPLQEELASQLEVEFHAEVDSMFHTLTETDKKQIKLAKFLGAKDGNGTDKCPNVLINVPNYYGRTDTCVVQMLKFNSRWEWLMLVVDEIESLGFAVEITETYCKITHSGDAIVDVGGGNYDKLSATFEACYQFVCLKDEA